jgi:hypothetical protein
VAAAISPFHPSFFLPLAINSFASLPRSRSTSPLALPWPESSSRR